MTARTVSNLPAAMHVETATVSVCNRIEQAELGYRIQYAAVREDQSPHLDWMQMGKATRVDRGGAGTCQPRDGSGGRSGVVLRGRL